MTLCFLSPKHKRAAFFAAACFILSLCLASACIASKNSRYAHYDGMTYCLDARDCSEHQAFARQFGLEIGSYPVMIQKVRIPQSFDGFYSGYNDLQKTVGLELFPFRGKKCTLYTYRLTGGNNAEPASVNLLVLRGKIIGGDVTEDKYPGVIRSFSGKIYNAHDK